MSDVIKNDDEKFNDLVSKQSQNINYDVHSRPTDDVIENDDNKMDDLLCLQSLSEGMPEHASLEEKYEEEIMINEVTKMLDEDFRRRRESPDNDPFAEFFREKEDEQW